MIQSRTVKLVVQVKLLPTPEQASALEHTLHRVNTAANQVAAIAFALGLRGRELPLRTLCYGDLKADGLGAQAAQHVIKRVVDAYTTLRANIRNGNLGGPASARRRKAESKPIVFRADAAHAFDDRNLSWQLDAGTVSIWTTAGRCKNLKFACSPDQAKTLAAYRKGESDLVHRDGKWFLIATCDVPESEVNEPPTGWAWTAASSTWPPPATATTTRAAASTGTGAGRPANAPNSKPNAPGRRPGC